MGLKASLVIEKVNLSPQKYYCNLGTHTGNGDSVTCKIRVYVSRAVREADPNNFIAEIDVPLVAVHPSENTKSAHYKGLKNLSDWANGEDVLE